VLAGRLTGHLYPYERGKRDQRRFAVPAITGSTFAGSTDDYHAHPFAVQGYGEWRNWALAMAVCGPGGVIVEVGANVGTDTVGYSDIVGEHGRVVAFEPLASNRAALQDVVARLDHRNVTLLPYALSDRTGTATFAVPSRHMSQGTGHLLGTEEHRSGQASYYGRPVEMDLVDVGCRTLDELAGQLSGMSLLLADTEGAEVSILRGGKRTIDAQRPPLVLEASIPHLSRAGHGLEDLGHELASLRYRPFAIGRLDLAAIHESHTHPLSRNWLCLPEERLDLLRRARRYLRRCGLAPCTLGLNPMAQVGGAR
jgi:FkbM family methyltransferase